MSRSVFKCIDAHTCGNPVRLIVEGFTQVGKRGHFPLKLTQTDRPIQDRIVFIGNAAHNLHPIAGQGFNLGLREASYRF